MSSKPEPQDLLWRGTDQHLGSILAIGRRDKATPVLVVVVKLIRSGCIHQG
jgi:hypothetical protein